MSALGPPPPSPQVPKLLHGVRSTASLPQGNMLTSQGQASQPCVGIVQSMPAELDKCRLATPAPLKSRDEPILTSNIHVASTAGALGGPSHAGDATNPPSSAPKLVVHGLVVPISRRPGGGNAGGCPTAPKHRLGRRVSRQCDGQHFCWKGSCTPGRRHDRCTWGCNRLIFSLTGHDGRRPRGKRGGVRVRNKITNLLAGIASAHHLPQKWWFWAEPAPI